MERWNFVESRLTEAEFDYLMTFEPILVDTLCTEQPIDAYKHYVHCKKFSRDHLYEIQSYDCFLDVMLNVGIYYKYGKEYYDKPELMSKIENRLRQGDQEICNKLKK